MRIADLNGARELAYGPQNSGAPKDPAERPWDLGTMRRWLKRLEIPAGVGPEKI
jgi:hypothetical protein